MIRPRSGRYRGLIRGSTRALGNESPGITVALTRREAEWLGETSRREQVSMSEVIRRLIDGARGQERDQKARWKLIVARDR